MTTELVHIGHGNILAMNRVIAIVSPASSPIKRLVKEGKARGISVDVTMGHRTKAVIIMDSGHIVLAAVSPETIAGRLAVPRKSPEATRAPREE